MDLRAMLNNDVPAASPSRPPVQQPQPRRPVAPPPPPPLPLQTSHPPFPAPSPGGRYGSAQHSPYPHASPTTPKAYPFPPTQYPPLATGPPQSPLSQLPPHQQPQQGYGSPADTPHGAPHTPHPLSAHSTVHSSTPTSAVIPSPRSQFAQPPPPIHSPHYGPQQAQQHAPSSYNQYQHQRSPYEQHVGYPQQSPIASPVEGRSGFHPPPPLSDGPTSSGVVGGAPAPRQSERDRPSQRPHERDISISPKTKVAYLPADEDYSPVNKKEAGYESVAHRPTHQQQHQSPIQPPPTALTQPQGADYSRRGSSVTTLGRNDIMDVDDDRKWSSPVSDRTKPNGSGLERRDEPQHPSPQQQHHQNGARPPPGNHTASSTSHQMSPPPKEQALANSRHQPPSPKSQPQLQNLRPPPTPTHQQNNNAPGDGQSSNPTLAKPPRKRPRRDEAPVWARKASRSSSSSPVMPARRQPSMAQASPTQSQHPLHAAAAPPLTSHPPAPQQPRPPPPTYASGPGLKTLPGFGPWESTITNIEPFEEIPRHVANFLFRHVVQQNDPALINAGPDGPVIEIEAKIGHLIDKATNDRLRLPVLSETVFNTDDPSWRIQFRSSMTDVQHRSINSFLNKVLIESKHHASPSPDTPDARIPLEYVHTRERDSFYELPAEKYHLLPPTIRETLNPRHKTRVRVTTDQKSGEVLKKIVKARIADMNVYSPRTAFDWRVSVNMEMPYGGDCEGLYPLGGGAGCGEERAKDRLSYKHLVYQVDLTQVTDASAKKEHELEVEMDGAEIRKQGLLAKEKRENGYEQLVKGFVDNVRVLIRAINTEA